MTTKSSFQTATMARILSDQGRYGEAIEIYRQLLQASPDHKDYQRGLDATIAAWRADTPRRLAGLFDQWLELALKLRRLRTLRHLSDPK
jgi:hypothetical protein